MKLKRSEAIKFGARLEAAAPKGTSEVRDVIAPNGKMIKECSPEYIGDLIRTMAEFGIEPPDNISGSPYSLRQYH